MPINEKTFGWKNIYKGFKELIDPETGELIISNEINQERLDVNFKKVWIKNLLFAIGLVGDKSAQVLSYILDNIEYDNRLLANKAMMVRDLGVSPKTVYKVIKVFLENDILKKEEFGYTVNPHIIFDGSAAKKKGVSRLEVVMKYYGYKMKDKKTFYSKGE